MGMKRYMVDFLNLLLSFLGRLKRRYVPSAGENKLNLGSHFNIAPGWINVDMNPHILLRKLPQPLLKFVYHHSGIKKWMSVEEYIRILKNNTFIYHNLSYGIPLPDESVDFVFSSHMLEHFYPEDALKLLKEIHRVLRKGGIVRISVPDLEYVVSLYAKGEKERFLSFFFRSKDASYLTQHRYMYDFELLKQFLEKAGFKNIRRRKYQEGDVPDIDILDTRPEESLFVEARKL